MNQSEVIREHTERVERLIFLEDLQTLPESPERDALIRKYEDKIRKDAQ